MSLPNRRTITKQLLLAGIASRCTLGGGGNCEKILAADQPPAPHFPAVREAMKAFVEEKEISGAVTLVASSEKVLHLDATGFADLASQKPLQSDSIFWIASMTKPMTGVCVMMLVEEGKLKLDAPISDYLPEMKGLALSDGTPARITLRHLLTHTSGMAELPGGEAYSSKNLKEAASRYAKVKVLFAPGSKWQYSQTSINTAACIVETVSGKPFDVFLEERVCKPLGMKDTAFYLSDSQCSGLLSPIEEQSRGSWRRHRSVCSEGRNRRIAIACPRRMEDSFQPPRTIRDSLACCFAKESWMGFASYRRKVLQSSPPRQRAK